MNKIIAVSNHKGGVGKTTSVLNIGAGLAKLGKRVLLIDMDPQANLSQCLGIVTPERTVYDAIKNGKALAPVQADTNLDIVPSTIELKAAEVELHAEAGGEYVLKELIGTLNGKYDFIMIDCPPSLGLLTLNALTAADQVFIPIQAQYLALEGLDKLMETIDKIKKRINKNLEVGGLIITQFDSRKILNRAVADSIMKHFNNKVFETKIRDNVALAEAPSSGEDIFRFKPKSYGAEDYMALSEEIVEKFKG